MLTVTFYGVRGSTPCSGDEIRRYGGNTSCVLVEPLGDDPIILDLGTGLRRLGLDMVAGRIGSRGPAGSPCLTATALVSHLHWDHIQGVPFFKPMLEPGGRLRIIGPVQDGMSCAAAFAQFLRPPAFPVSLDVLPGEASFADVTDEQFEIGEAKVSSFSVPHTGPTNGYRIDLGGASVVYISDHQMPIDGSHHLGDDLIEWCRDVDILIHDAQYDADEFAQRAHWGHCTPDYALELARAAGASRLVLYHHDPAHDDDWIDAMVADVQARAGGAIEVLGAAEGLRLTSGL